MSSQRRTSFAKIVAGQASFSAHVLQMPLHPYQERWADYVYRCARECRNETVTVEMPRQSGKNEASAHIEVALMAVGGKSGGQIVKCAPTWKPQIVNSKLRFDARAAAAQERLKFLKIKPTMGYMYRAGNALIAFLSASRDASVVGATASMLMEVDEAQDVDKAKYDKDFNPMRASTGAPTVFYGTTWTDDTLLEREKRKVLEGRAKGKVFRILPEEVALDNPAYGDFVDAEVDEKGRDHPFIKTQYFLEPLPSAGRMLKPMQLRMMLGFHERAEKRTDERQIVAGLDFAGADEAGEEAVILGNSARDSVALTVGSVQWAQIAEGLAVPIVRILARYEWVNVRPDSLHTALYQILWERWRVDMCHCDSTGIGETGTAFLAKAINKQGRDPRIAGRKFDSAWNTHTELAFDYIAAINGGRIQDYVHQFDPIAEAGKERTDTGDVDRHTWWQRGHAKLEAKPGKKVSVSVPEAEGHDDMIMSELLMMGAAHDIGKPKTAKSGTVDFYG